MIDLHARVLPGIHDGPCEMQGSLEGRVAAAGDGTRVMAATPHASFAQADTDLLFEIPYRPLARAVRGPGQSNVFPREVA